MSTLLRAIGIVGTLSLVGYAMVLMFGEPEADEAVEDVIADAQSEEEVVEAEVLRRRERVAQVARGITRAGGPDGEARPVEDDLAPEVPAPTVPYGSGELDSESARSSFDYAMNRVESVGRSRKWLMPEDWEKLYREANDSFTALSIVLDPSDESDSAELELAYVRLKKGLKRVRVRGRKLGT